MNLRVFPQAAALLAGALLLALPAHATSYYISNSGNNSNNGTSTSTPWADFTNVNTKTFSAGDTINLECGSSWQSAMTPAGSGTSGDPITITSYSSGSCSAAPVIYGTNTSGQNLISLTNPSWWTIENLELKDADNGIVLTYGENVWGSQGITIANNYIHNIRVTEYESFAISFVGNPNALPSSSQYALSGINIYNNTLDDIETGIQFYQGNYPQDISQYSWQNIDIRDNNISDMGDAAIVLYGVTNALIMDNYMYELITEGKSGGTCGNFQDTTNEVTWVNNYIDYTENEGVTDQTGLDLELQVNNTNLWTNYFGATYGPAVEMLQLSGRSGDYNTNSSFLGNTFYGDGTESIQDTTPGSSLQTLSQTASSITGTISNSISYQASNNFLATSGPNSFTESNNLSVSSGNVYYFAAGYSGTQGTNGWAYQTFNGGTWSNMSYSGSTAQWTGGNGGYIAQMSMQAPSSTGKANGILWTAPSTGTMSLRGRVLMDTTGGSGVNAYWGYTHNGTWIQEWTHSVGGSDQTGYDITTDSIPVTAGDVFAFYVFPTANSDSKAVVSWQPSLSYITPGGSNLLGNPNFATGSESPWTTWVGSGSSSDVYVQACAGSGVACYGSDVYNLAMWNGSSSYYVSAYQCFTGQPSSSGFTASVYAYTATNATAGSIYAQDGPGGTVLCSTTVPGNNGGWNQYSCTGTVPADGKLCLSLGSGNTEPATAWIVWDNASLTD